jgi:hypothetical protein
MSTTGPPSPHWLFWTHPDLVSDQNAEAAYRTWYTGDSFRRYPPKSRVRASVESVLEGWIPPEPIIHPTTRVLALGSCFAGNFVEWLLAHGYNLPLADHPHGALLRNAFESVSVLAQQFRWAFGEFDPATALWFDKDKRPVEPTEERRLALRGLLEGTDVLIATLGLSEVWYDTLTGEPLWRVMPVAYHDPRRHAFKVESVADTVRALEVIDRIRARWLPSLKVLYTVSPLRCLATFRPVSAVTANSVSKAIVRAALDEFLRSRWALVNATYFYYPSYEVVTDVLVDPFTEDQNHLHEHVLALVLDLFARHYTTFEPAGGPAGTVAPPGGLEDRLARVERAYTERVQQLAVLSHRCAQLDAEVAAFRRAAGPGPAGDSRRGLARGLRTTAGTLARLVSRPRRRR